MASEKALRKQMRQKKKVAQDIGLLDKEKKINRALSAANKTIAKTTKKTFEKNLNKKSAPRKTSATPEIKDMKKMPAEFDEFGVVIFKTNADDIVVSLPDFSKQKYTIEKSDRHTYEELITDMVLKTAVNDIRHTRRTKKTLEGIKNPSNIGLKKAIPSSHYCDGHPTIDIKDIDTHLHEVEPPAYTFIPLNIKSVCQQADKSLNPMEFKEGIHEYKKLTKDDPYFVCEKRNVDEVFFEQEVDTIIKDIRTNFINEHLETRSKTGLQPTG